MQRSFHQLPNRRQGFTIKARITGKPSPTGISFFGTGFMELYAPQPLHGIQHNPVDSDERLPRWRPSAPPATEREGADSESLPGAILGTGE
jgi:hypothetical protein